VDEELGRSVVELVGADGADDGRSCRQPARSCGSSSLTHWPL
jgi:hypothetical protein